MAIFDLFENCIDGLIHGFITQEQQIMKANSWLYFAPLRVIIALANGDKSSQIKCTSDFR